MHVQSCCFVNLNLLLFCHSCCRRRRRCLSSLEKPLWRSAVELPYVTTFIISYSFYSCKRPLVSRSYLRVRCLYTTLLRVFKEILNDNYAYRNLELQTMECFHSRGRHLYKFIGTKESVCIRKVFNSHRTSLGHQHGRRFIVLGHQYGRHDVM